jgi:hypothetical protein
MTTVSPKTTGFDRGGMVSFRTLANAQNNSVEENRDGVAAAVRAL